MSLAIAEFVEPRRVASWVVVLQYMGGYEDGFLDEALDGTARGYKGRLEEARFDVEAEVRELQFDFDDQSAAEEFVAHVRALYRVDARVGWSP